MPTPLKLQLESHLAAAHRRLFYAERCARDLGKDHLADDLEQMLREVTRIQEDTLKREGRLRSR